MDEKKLKALEELENQQKGIDGEETVNSEEIKKENKKIVSEDNTPSTIDGYKEVLRKDLPQEGKLYPESWRIFYRCPESKEVANFSTIDENDNIAIMMAIEDLIRKCFVIVDSNNGNRVSSGELIDGQRMFFLLLLREYYLPGKFISYNTMCVSCKEPVEVHLTAKSLRYKDITDKFLESYDGRNADVNISTKEGMVNIKFVVPTLNTTSRVFRYMINTYKKAQGNDGVKKDKEVFDKQFLLIINFLYETGHETIEQLKHKFNNIKKDGKLLEAYVILANNFKMDNYETIYFTHDCGSEEEAQIKFPGGWKGMFIDESSVEELFG